MTAEPISIAPLLTRLAYPGGGHVEVEAVEIAAAFALIFEDRLSLVQAASLLTLLHATGRDKDAEVIVQCASRMREAAVPIARKAIEAEMQTRAQRLAVGEYKGGFVGVMRVGGLFRLTPTVRHCRYGWGCAPNVQHIDHLVHHRIPTFVDRKAWQSCTDFIFRVC